MVDEAAVVGSKLGMECAIGMDVCFFPLLVPKKVLSCFDVIAI